MQFEWFTGNIDEALFTDDFDNPRLADGSAWADFAAAVGRAGSELQRDDVPQSPVDQAAGYRHLFAMVANGIIQAMVPADPLAPTFGAYNRTDVFKWGLDCPDAAYLTVAIRGDLTYRVTGNVGSVRYLSFQANTGMANHGNIRNDELTTDADGNFELWIGPDEAGLGSPGGHHQGGPLLGNPRPPAGEHRHRRPRGTGRSDQGPSPGRPAPLRQLTNTPQRTRTLRSHTRIMDLGLKDATVVVTGGTGGMGRAAADCLADDGARVAVLARSQKQLDETVATLTERGSPDAVGISVDLFDGPSVDRAIAEVGERWGHLNALVNVAGPMEGGLKSFETYTDEDAVPAAARRHHLEVPGHVRVP